jgi:hypothetical protein
MAMLPLVAQSAPPSSPAAPFDRAADVLPANYQGHSVLEVMKALNAVPKKREFERTEEFDARLAKWADTPFRGSLTPGSLFAFEVPPKLSLATQKIDYDADAEILTVNVHLKNRFLGTEPIRWLETFGDFKTLGARSAVTRMGVRFRVEMFEYTSVGLAFPEMLNSIAVAIPMPRRDAQSIKPNVTVFAVATVREPFKVYERDDLTASLDDPRQAKRTYLGLYIDLQSVWVVDRRTGQVLGKSAAPFKRCDYDTCAW